MPPKPKVTREEVAEKALEIIRTNGIEALTARDLGKSLGTSARPIFTVFNGMEEVKEAARELALVEFKEYISNYQYDAPAFKRIGMMLILYGIREPELFKLLFMQEHKYTNDVAGSLKDLGGIELVCVELIQKDFETTKEQAVFLLEQMWATAYGLGVMCAMKVCSFSEEEIGNRLGVTFTGLLMLVKSGKLPNIYADVKKNEDGEFHGIKVSNPSFLPQFSEVVSFNDNSIEAVFLPYFGQNGEQWLLTYPAFQVALNKDLEKDRARYDKAMKVLNVMFSEEGQNVLAGGDDVISYSQNVTLELSPYLANLTPLMKQNHTVCRTGIF